MFWEVELLQGAPRARVAVPEPAAALRPSRRRARCIDHVTIATADPEGDNGWYRDTLGPAHGVHGHPRPAGFRRLRHDDVCERSHDLGVVWDPTGVPGRVNHVAYFVESRGAPACRRRPPQRSTSRSSSVPASTDG